MAIILLLLDLMVSFNYLLFCSCADLTRKGIIQITDRSGGIVDEIPLSTNSPVLNLEWDKDGEYLAILQEGNTVVPLWNLVKKQVIPLETGFSDPSFLCWSKTGPQLAIGTAKGNVLLYNKQQKKKIPVMGKHAKKIICGAWSRDGNKLGLGSADCTITVSNDIGETLIHSELKTPSNEMSFCNRSAAYSRQKNSESQDDTISANLGGKSILLLNFLNDKEDPMELTFASNSNGSCRYGEITHYEWYNDNMLLIGFSYGWVIVVSTDPSVIGEEKYSIQIHSSKLTSFAYNPYLKRVATAVGDGIRVIDTRDFKEIKTDFISLESVENGKIRQIGWSPDGQILSVATQAGNIYNFLAKISILYASHKSNLCYLSSLREVTVVNTKRRTRPLEISLQLEPTVIAIGPHHVAAGMNNKVYYHRIQASSSGNNGSGSDVVNEQEYISTIREVQLNKNFACVLTDNKVILHPIEPSAQFQQQSKTFPLRDEGTYSKVTCCGLTDDFLYYGTEAGSIEVFSLGEWIMLPGVELRLDHPIKRIYPNSSGTRLVVVDSLNQIFLYNPVTGGGVNQSITPFDLAPSIFSHIIWDASEKNVIMISDGRYIHSYIYIPFSIRGPMVTKLGPVEISPDGGIILKSDKAEIPIGNIIVMSDGGMLTCQTVTGSVNTFLHPYFDQLNDHTKDSDNNAPSTKLSQSGYIAKYWQSLALLRLEDAWQAALELDKREYWLALSGKALELLNVELAVRVYRQLGDAGMVMALQKCLHIEDKYLLGGHIALLFSDYPRAQELFLMSSKPIAALDMQCDLMYWDQALKLATNIAVNRIPFISIKYAQQMEFKDENEKALRLYQSGLDAVDNDGLGCCPDHLAVIAKCGEARCNLKLGQIRAGISLANKVDSKVLYGECGEILEQLKQYQDAVQLYIKADLLERAAEIYIQNILKNDKSKISEAANILERVKSSQLNSYFGKACEAVGRYVEAAAAYERAKDVCKVVEIKLRHLDAVQQAFDLVRETASSEAAVIVANYCLEVRDYRGAIEFLLMAKKSDEAYKLAQTHNQVDTYATLLGDSIGADDALRVATYYEKAQDLGKAGKYVF
jgi:WD repeat-containing protein 19